MNSNRPFLIIALVLLVAAAGTALLLKSNQDRDSSSRLAETQSPDQAKNIAADTVVTLEEFGDYQCPPCGQLHPTLKQLKQQYGANLNFIFRNLPSIFIKFAADLGLNTVQFTRDMDDKQIQMRIEADEDAAAKQGIDGTPTILINGRQLRAEMTTPEGVSKGIELMMSAKGAPSP